MNKEEISNQGKIYVTGKIQDLNKAEIRYIVEQLGFQWSTTISSLTLLVIGKNPGQNKIETADRLNIRKLSWDEFAKEYNFEVKREAKQDIVQDNNISPQIAELITKTKNKKSQTRLVAYSKLIEYKEEFVTDILVKALADELGTIRKLAFKELEKRNFSELSSKFYELLENRNEKIRKDSVKALCKLEENPNEIEYLGKAMKDRSYDIRLIAIDGLSKILDPEVNEILVEALKDKYDIPGKALAGLVTNKYPDLEKVLKDLSYSSNQKLARIALKYLKTRVSEPEREQILLDRIHHEPNKILTKEALDYFRLRLSREEFIEFLVLSFDKTKHNINKTVILSQLSLYEEAQQFLNKNLKNENAYLRKHVLELLTKRTNPETKKLLIAATDDSLAATRKLAYEKLIERYESKAMKFAYKALKDSDEDVRLSVVSKVYNIIGQTAKSTIFMYKTLKDPSEKVRRFVQFWTGLK